MNKRFCSSDALPDLHCMVNLYVCVCVRVCVCVCVCVCVLTAFEKTDSSNWSMVLPGLFVLHIVLPVQVCLL